MWYLAEIVLRINVEGDARNVVHKNLMLLAATSPEDAYDKANALGADHTMSYSNPQGKEVHIQFLGLSRLNVVCDQLEDGAELLYEEQVDIPEETIQRWITPRHLLGVFRAAESTNPVDYSSAEVLNRASKLLRRDYRL